MTPNERDQNEVTADTKRDVEPAHESDVPADEPTVEVAEPAPVGRKLGRKLGRTRASGMWAGLIIAAIVLIFLLVFILQNLDSVEITFLMFSGSLPIGVAVLLAAIAGILMVAVPGVARMIQLRRHARR